MIPGLSAQQEANAAAIIAVAKQQFSDPQQQRQAALIGIITAITESGLNNVPYGDRDSVGLFQQRASWGTTAQRMDPTTSAQKFYERLKTVPNWDTIDPGVAAQKVQVSAFPDRYDTHLALGNATVTALLASAPSGGSSSSGGTNLIGVPNSVWTPEFWLRIGVGALGAVILSLTLIAILKSSPAANTIIDTVKETAHA